MITFFTYFLWRIIRNVQRAVFQLYSGWKQVQYYIKTILQWGKGWVNDFWLPLRKYWELGGGKQFCSDYNVPTLFRNQQKSSLACMGHGTLQIHYPLLSTVTQAFHNITWHPPLSRGLFYPPPGVTLSISVGWALGTFTSTQYKSKVEQILPLRSKKG